MLHGMVVVGISREYLTRSRGNGDNYCRVSPRQWNFPMHYKVNYIPCLAGTYFGCMQQLIYCLDGGKRETY